MTVMIRLWSCRAKSVDLAKVNLNPAICFQKVPNSSILVFQQKSLLSAKDRSFTVAHLAFLFFTSKNHALLSSMPPPNPLSIATSSLKRLIREEASYHKEQQQQEAAIAKLESQSEDKEDEGEEGNREFTLTQQVCFSPVSASVPVTMFRFDFEIHVYHYGQHDTQSSMRRF